MQKKKTEIVLRKKKQYIYVTKIKKKTHSRVKQNKKKMYTSKLTHTHW